MTENKPQDPYYYEEMIDLRALVRTLGNYKWIIISATLLTTLTAFLTIKFILSPKYEASAHIGIKQPTFVVYLEPSINGPSPLKNYRSFLNFTSPLSAFAEADEVWLSVCEDMNITCLGEGSDSPDLEATLIGSSHLHLSVSSGSPERSAEFANFWAGELINRWNMLYSSENIDLIQAEEEVAQALENWNTARNALEEYLLESQINVLEVQLNQAKQKLAIYLGEIEENESILRDADALDFRLDKQIQTSKLLIGDALSLVGLLQRTTGSVSGTELQIMGTDIYGLEYTIAESRETLADLVFSLENQNDNLEIQLVDLEGEITTLAMEKQAEQYQIALLEGERDRALSDYQDLSEFMDEARNVPEYLGPVAYIIANAVVPQEESGLSTTILVALAGMMGLMISVVSVFVYTWWNSEKEAV